MWYEINVSLNGKHLFATHKRSITSDDDLKRALPIMRAKFPESEGFAVAVTHMTESGHELTDRKLNKILDK
jgi:hypothetical protein